MKILIIINSNFLSAIGGSERQVLRLAKGFHKLGHEVVILTRTVKGLPTRELYDGILIERKIWAPLWGKLFGIFYILSCLIYLFGNRHRFDVLYARFIYLECIAAGFLKALGLLKRPFIATAECPGNNPLFLGDIHRLRQMKLWRFWRQWILKIDRFNDTGSIELTEELLNYGVPQHKIVSIFNAVDSSVFRPSTKKEPLSKTKVLFVGRLVKQKGLEFLLRAWEKVCNSHKGIELHIVGDGPEKGILLDLTHNLGIKNTVFFHNATPEPEVYMRESNIFIHPSLAEGFGIVIAEAMMCGLPVIATRCAWLKNMPDRDIALLIDSGDVGQIVQALFLFLEDRELRQAIAKRGLHFATEHFETTRVAQEYIRIFQELNKKP